MERDKSHFLGRWISAGVWKVRTSAHTDCIYSWLCEGQPGTIISSQLHPVLELKGDSLRGDGRKTRAIHRDAKLMFRLNLGSPTASSRDMPMIRARSMPHHRINSKKHDYLSSLRSERRERRKMPAPCVDPRWKKLWYKKVWYKK